MLLQTIDSDKLKKVLTINVILVMLLIGTTSLLIISFSKNKTIKEQLVTAQSPIVITMIIGESPKPVLVKSANVVAVPTDGVVLSKAIAPVKVVKAVKIIK